MKRMIRILFYFCCISNIMYAQPNQDSCNCYAKAIFSTFKKLENKYIEVVKEKLLLSISEDKKLSNTFFEDDSSCFKDLKIYINPILKLSSEAKNYTFKENLCKYFVFDTINYDCSASFYLGDTIVFFITRGKNDCDLMPLNPGGDEDPFEWCPGDFYFKQNFYSENLNKNCLHPGFDVIIDTSFVFFIDGLYNAFIIKNNLMSIYLENYNSRNIKLLDKPSEFIKQSYDEQWIRRCAKDCPFGGKKPWWKFW